MNRCIGCRKEISETATYCLSCAGKMGGKRRIEKLREEGRLFEVCSEMGKIGGKRTVELHPNHLSEIGKIGVAKQVELGIGMFALEMRGKGGKRTMELHPNQASEMGKRIKELGRGIFAPGMQSKGARMCYSYERKGIKELRIRNVQVVKKGWPDCFCISQKGKRFCVEFKPSLSCKLSSEQEVMIHELQRFGLKCYIGDTEGKLKFIKLEEEDK